MNTDISSDSETMELQIDVSEVDNSESPNKYKRDVIEEASILSEMEEEIERQLDARATKTNLTVTNVKNMLKHVITNERVIATVRNRLQNTNDEVVLEPRLTRAKAKELAMLQPDIIPWPITSGKTTPALKVRTLIENALSEDSSDEEYNPDQDQKSDNDKKAVSSDADFQPATSMDRATSSEQSETSTVQYDPEGIFKIPGNSNAPVEDESIGQRTRSKLCLSETSLEQIEQAFIPPDITTDMYDWDCDLDEDWDNFLKEFAQPLTQEPVVEDDPEADPEYKILEDEETDLLDKEELRMDRAVKVSRKELNNLVAELFEFMDFYSKEQQEVPKKDRCNEISNCTVENVSLNASAIKLLPVLAESELPELVNVEQRLLLATQVRQHVQLMAQHFAMAYMHPELHYHAKTCKENLNSIRFLSNGPNSAFNAENLSDALKLVFDWEDKFKNPKFRAEYINMITEEVVIGKVSLENSHKYIPRFHPELIKLFLESKALMYPHLLPATPLRNELRNNWRSKYLVSEENLIALGLEQYIPFVASKPCKFKSKKMQLMDAVRLIIQYLLPCREVLAVYKYIERCRNGPQSNPIKHYFTTGTAPRTVHYITQNCDVKAPKEHSISVLPANWQNYLKGVEEDVQVLKRKRLLKLYNKIVEQAAENDKLKTKHDDMRIDHNLRNSIVNMLPNMPPLNINIRSKSDADTKTTTDALESKSETSLTTSRSSSLDIKLDINAEDSSNDLQDSAEPKSTAKLPELRKTTPRLAKIRSAQNMKLMAQSFGSKNLSVSCSGIKSRNKCDSSKNLETSSSKKVDNEEEIAELMLASTTIKKNTTSRKKAKLARELENIKRLFEADNDLSQEERATKYAASYLQKLHVTLESNHPEVFKTVIKLYLDYSEKIDAINQMDNDEFFQSESNSSQGNATTKEGTDMRLNAQSFTESKQAKEKYMIEKDLLTINLYKDVCEKLKNYPELCTDFLLFLKPHQASIIGKSVEHTMLQKMSEFVFVAQIYFAKQPSRLAKMMQAITQLASDPCVTLERVHTVMSPVLKGHPFVMDMFLQVLPNGKSPESLFVPHMFENLICPLGPHDRNKLYVEDAPELYENIEIPISTSQEDPYGGDNCKCECHNVDEPDLKTRTEHCVSCGTRFLNGRIYLQTSEGLRPAKITFPGTDQEKIENITRVSLKTSDKCITIPSTRRRRKSSKNEPSQDETVQKQLSHKNSPIKDNEDNDKVLSGRFRRSVKSPPKLDPKLKCSETKAFFRNCTSSDKSGFASSFKTKRDERAEKREAKLEQKNMIVLDHAKLNETLHSDSKNSADDSKQLIDSNNWSVGSCSKSNHCENEYLDHNSTMDFETLKTTADQDEAETNISLEKMDVSSDSNDDANTKTENVINVRAWTRQEDTILLQNIKNKYSENTFLVISETLGDRTVQQVKERFHILLSLLEKMT